MPSPNKSGISGAFVPTSDVYDVDIIRTLDVQGDEFKEFLVRLRQSTNNLAIAINYRDAGYYVEELFNCGQVFFPNKALSSSTRQTPLFRPVIRKVVDFGALPNNMTKSVPHNIPNIDTNVTYSRIYGTATNPTTFRGFPVPNYDVATGNITGIIVDAANVNITTNWNATAYTRCVVIIEFFKG